MQDPGSENIDPTSKEFSDRALLGAIAEGNERAFQAFFHRYYRSMVNSAFRIVGDLDTAKDLAQDLFFWVWKNRARLEIHTAVGAYLKRAIVNRCLNHLKRESKWQDTPDWDEPVHTQANPQELVEAEDLKKEVDQALQQLPERCRLVFTLKRFEGLSIKEIAEELDISPKTVENQITKALKHLREALKSHLVKNNRPP